MNTTNNTILVTGGSAGIGLEIAKLFSVHGNHIIITGRDEKRLLAAAVNLENVTTIQSDVSNADDVTALVARLEKDFPNLNMVVNNAGRASVHDLAVENPNVFDIAQDEMTTNYLSVIRLNEKLLPLLKRQASAAIINVSSIVVFVPSMVLSTYSASKAALHSYSKSLRLALEDSTVKVFEVMPPLVNTEFSKEIGGANGIPPSEVAQQFFDGILNDNFEIHVGNTEDMYQLYLSSPANALEVMNAGRRQLA